MTGKWYFSAIRRQDEQEPVSQKLMEFAVGRNSFKQFNANSRLIAYENGDYSYGTWKLTDDMKKLMTISDAGNINVYIITRLTADSMTLFVAEKYVSFVHAHDTLSHDRGVYQTPVNAIKATHKQLVNKWVFSSLTDSVGTPRPLSDVLKGTWYDLREDGTYSKKVTSSKTGKWDLQENGKLLVVIDDDGSGKCWYILDVSNRTLTLQAPGFNDRIIYEAE